MNKRDQVRQIFLDAGFNDNELDSDGMFADLLSTAQGLSECYPAIECVILAIYEAQGLLRRLERSMQATAQREVRR